ncbi:MAG: NUDIX hydrolase [Candidatus Aminicenantes bacterium]
MSIQQFFRSLEKGIKGPKPGPKAQLKMVTQPRPGHRKYHEVEHGCLKAGVLVLLYPWKNQIHLVLTRRTEHMSLHQAQISFPGGRQEQGESIEHTALRETQEELSTPGETIRTLGRLTPLYIPPTNYCIYPVVAVMKKRPNFIPSPREVAEVIEVPLDHLLDPTNIHKEEWILGGRKMTVPFYLFQGHKIWGATAMVLSELLEIVRRTLPPQPS